MATLFLLAKINCLSIFTLHLVIISNYARIKAGRLHFMEAAIV